MATINGTNQNDILIGTLVADLVNARAGDDYANGDDGNDIMNGGSGNDTLFGGAGNDILNGGADNDALFGEEGNDILTGGAGNDYLDGGTGNDILAGGAGDDTLFGDEGELAFTTDNLVTNGSFEDPDIVDNNGGWQEYPNGIAGWTNSGGTGPELQDSSAGLTDAAEGDQYLELDSSVNSAIYQDIATDGTGSFQLEFSYSPREGVAADSNGVEVWWNGELLDTLTGDTEGWTTHTYTVEGAGDTTRLEFRAVGTSDGTGGLIDDIGVRGVEVSSDVLDGGAGDDTLFGGADNDTLLGGAGADILYGEAGDDTLNGGNGADELDGGDGADTLLGGNGADMLTGGEGADIFDFTAVSNSTTTNTDIITDWEAGLDKIDLTGLGFTGIAAGAAAGTTLGYAEVDGDTVITAANNNFALTLEGTHTLSNADFFFA